MKTTTLRAPLLLVLALAAGCAGTSRSHKPSKEQQLELYTTTATYLYEDNSLVRAQDQAVKALELDPSNKTMRRMVGWIRLRMGSNEDLLIAERFFRDLVAEGDTNSATLLGLATTVERLGTAYDAASRRIASGKQDPSEGRTAEDESKELAGKAQDLWHEALQRYDDTLKNGEGNTNAMNGLQRVYALLGEYEKSLEWSEKLLQRSSEELEAWRRMLTQQDLTDREETVYRENERVASDLQSQTHLFAATLLQNLDRPAEAIEHLDAVATQSPDMPQVYSLRAQLHARSGEYQLAIEDLDRFLRLSDAPYEDPEVRHAFDLRTQYEAALAKEPTPPPPPPAEGS